MCPKLLSRFTSLFLAFVFASSTFSPVMAAPPANDDFTNPEAITGLPFTSLVDVTDATNAGEPMPCYYVMERTVWYSYTPSENTGVRVDTLGTVLNRNVNVYRADGPNLTDLTFLYCVVESSSVSFLAEAGVTYYLQAGTVFDEPGTVQVNLEEIPTPANDMFVDAIIIPQSPSFPFDTGTADISAAGTEPGEPTPSCAYSGLYQTVWYAFTPDASTTLSVNANAPFYSLLAAYSGNTLTSLTELGCSGPYGSSLSIQVEAGTTYYFQVGDYFGYQGGVIQLHLDITPPPTAGMYFYPYNPSRYDTIQFYDGSYDPGGLDFQSYTWDFGDGITSTEQFPSHRYEADGDYTVQHSVATVDGRTASTSQVVQVRTHDVTIVRVDSPEQSRAGRSERITVSVVNATAYSETVRVDLYRSVAGGGFAYVATLTLNSPPAGAVTKPTKYTFTYTFASDDTAIGKVIFRAIATIENAPDAFPQDNERLSSLTLVKE